MEVALNYIEHYKYTKKEKKENIFAKPFLKWAGGKTQLIEEIEKNLPIEIRTGKIKKYVEPFVGSGALFFYLVSKYNFEEIYINDANKELINTYKVIRNDVEILINELEKLQRKYIFIDEEKRSELFYEIRNLYNHKKTNEIHNAAYFIFLNRTCFNGLYRVNSKGKFNVPFGKYSNPKICDSENLINVSKLLKNVKILNVDFEETEKYIDRDTFVYFDPPYRPLNITSSFNSYSKDEFNDETQKRLAEFYRRLNRSGAKLMLSNSDPKNTDESDNFFDLLYSEFRIERVDAKRMINSNASKRGSIKELLIMNDKICIKEVRNMVSFEEFMSGLSDTNATLDFFTDFEKVNKNVTKISIKLNQLNYLIGKEDMKKAVYELYDENPKVFEVLDILIAIRTKDKKKVINEIGDFILIEEYFKTPEKIYEYIKETGLEKVFMAKEIKNLVDYVFGVEVGLDTNARKNRTGTFMEKAVAKIFEKNNIKYKREVYATEFPELTSLGDDLKRFDFVVATKRKNYLIEVNFYSGGGSKLNETARAYTDISPKINKYAKYEFVWITDGKGWEKAKSKLKEAYQNIDKVYNLQTIKNFINILKEEME